VAARYRPAEEFGFGSVSMRDSSAKDLQPEDIGASSFLGIVRDW
jgi:hypothetical protein